MTLEIVTQQQWGMPPIGANHQTRPASALREANIHHSDSPPPRDHDECAGVVRGFDAYHRSKGWACIGYNRVICTHGVVFLCRGWNIVPAAAENHNEPIIAYCLISKGNDDATQEQWDALVGMVARDEHNTGRVLSWTTHREVEPPGYTQCPGDGIENEVRAWRHH